MIGVDLENADKLSTNNKYIINKAIIKFNQILEQTQFSTYFAWSPIAVSSVCNRREMLSNQISLQSRIDSLPGVF